MQNEGDPFWQGTRKRKHAKTVSDSEKMTFGGDYELEACWAVWSFEP